MASSVWEAADLMLRSLARWEKRRSKKKKGRGKRVNSAVEN
jgi:hypothetical protein